MDSLTTLLSCPAPPPFVCIHHPHHPSTSIRPKLPSHCLTAQIDAIETYSARLLYSAIIRQLSALLEQGNEVEGAITIWDQFARRLRDLWRKNESGSKPRGKRKASEMMNGHAVNGHSGLSGLQKQAVLVVTKAERMRHVLGPGWAVVTRLNELVGIPFTVILCSAVPWDDLRPPRGDSIEPIHIYLPPWTREQIYSDLAACSTHPLWLRFLDLLLASLANLVPTSPPTELLRLAQPLWRIYTSNLPPHAEQTKLGRPYAAPDDPPPPLTVTVKLLTDLKHQLSLPLAAAIENLIPRSVGQHEFLQAFLPQAGLDGGLSGPASRSVPKPPQSELPNAARFLVVAAYCASYNPAKSDLRLFGRGLGADGRKKKGGGTRRAGYGRVRLGKVPQRLLGPKTFPLDRLLAIFAAIYAEHAERPEHLAPTKEDDSEEDDPYPSAAQAAARAERRRARDLEKEEAWDDEVHHLTTSVSLWAMIPELESQGLLRRMSPGDRLDNVILRCEADYGTAKTFARELRLTLDDYIYEAPT